MTSKTLNDVMRRVLNDPDIFYIYYPIFNNSDWSQLRELFKSKRFNELKDKINKKVDSLRKELKELNSGSNDKRREKIRKAIKFTEALKSAVDGKFYITEQIFLMLDKFGLVKCNLPNMEDYGKVIEIHNWEIAEQFFLYKIDKAKGYEKKALIKTLEYIKEMYAMKVDILEISFFVRKLNDLTQFMEVIL